MYSMHNIVSSKHAIGFYSCKTLVLSKYVAFVPDTVYKQDSVLKLKILLKSSEDLGINVPSGNLPSYVKRNWSSHAVHTILGFINKGPQTKMLPVYVISKIYQQKCTKITK